MLYFLVTFTTLFAIRIGEGISMITAIVLAGGESSRLRPMGDKSLQRFMGQTLLSRHLEILAEAGVEQAILVTNPLHHERLLAESQAVGSPAVHAVIQTAPLGMGEAVVRALDLVAPDAPVFLTQAHDLFAPGFHRAMLDLAVANPDTILIAARQVQEYFPGGYILPALPDFDASHPFAMRGILEKPKPGMEPSAWVTLVAHVIPHAGDLAAALARHTGGDPGDWYERALTDLMARTPTLAVPHAGLTAALKYPWHMLDCMELLFSQLGDEPQIAPGARVDPAAHLRGGVVIATGARVFSGAIIQGPAYIGRDVVVGNNALIRESMLGAHTIAGFGCEIARSWIGEDVWFHTSYVGDSVIDDDVHFGYGSVTSNVRLDDQPIKVTVKGQRIATGRQKLGQIVGAGARIGVNAMLMPGCVIGRHTLVGPGVVLREDVPDDMRILIRQDLVREPNTTPIERGVPPPIIGR